MKLYKRSKQTYVSIISCPFSTRQPPYLSMCFLLFDLWTMWTRFTKALIESTTPKNTLKANTHILRRAPAMPCPANSHIPCCAPTILRQFRVLRKSPLGSRKNPNCYSNSVTDPLSNSAALILDSRQHG
jgi:hypothetical protein